MRAATKVRCEPVRTRATERRHAGQWIALVVILALAFSACSSSEEADTESGAEAADAAMPAGNEEFDEEVEGDDAETDQEEMAEEEAMEEFESAEDDAMVDEEAPQTPDAPASEDGADPSGALGSGGAAVTPTAADLGRKLIFTARVEVGVDDVAAASAEATSIIEDMGGFLFGQNTVGGSQPSSELTFKVLPDDFNRALDALGTVGELRNQSVSTDDVTERIVDLESRIEVAELGVERLRNSLETTTDLDDFAQVERLLLERESDLEVMRGQLRTLQDRVDLATITLTVTQDRVENQVLLFISAYEGHDGGQSCPGQEGPRVEAGSQATICFDVVNDGDQTLTDIALTDTVLGLDSDGDGADGDRGGLIEVFGTIDELAPGQSALVAFEVSPERTQRLRTRVVAVPTDGVGNDAAGPAVSSQVGFDLRTFEPEGDPGFGDGFSVAVDFLGAIWVAIKVVIGFLIPMLILLPFIWLAWRGWKEFRSRRPPRLTGGVGGSAGPGGPAGPGGGPWNQPPPPAPAPPSPSTEPGLVDPAGQEVAAGAGTVMGEGTDPAAPTAKG